MYKPNYKFAIFDMDGTLLDSMYMQRTIALQYLRKHGQEELAERLHDRFLYLPVRRTVEETKTYCEQCHIPMITWEAVTEMLRENYRHVKPKPGALEFLELLKKDGVRMCVMTATSRALAPEALANAALDSYFEFVLTSEEFPRGKWSREIFDEALRRFGAAPKETALVDDALYSIETAKSLGIWTIGVQDDISLPDREQIIALADEYYEWE